MNASHSVIFCSAFALAACTAMPNAGLAPASAPAFVPANSVPPTITNASNELVGPVWQWERTQQGSGSAITPEAPDRYTLAFQAGGRVNVRADCNRGSGSVEVTGSQMKFGPVALTKMACPPGGKDMEFLGALARTTSYALDRDGLALVLPDGGSMRFRAAQ
jgi:heat shock protein HslJ